VGAKKANGSGKADVDIFDGDILAEVKRHLVQSRKGTRQISALVEIVLSANIIHLSYNPNVQENIIPLDSLEDSGGLFYKTMQRTTESLFPIAPMAGFTIFYEKYSRALKMRLVLQRDTRLTNVAAKRLAHAFVAGVTNHYIGTSCYQADFDLSGTSTHLPPLLVDSYERGEEVPYFVKVVVKNIGRCASNRRIGKDSVDD
jgi:hypothetical protein